MCVDVEGSGAKRKTEVVGGAVRPPAVEEPSASSEAKLTLEQQQAGSRGDVDGVRQATREVGLQPVSKEVFDLVCTCNVASRANKGDIVWFGYNCSDDKVDKKRTGIVSFGTQGVAFTKPAAKLLKEYIPTRKPKLFDMFLKETLHLDFSSRKSSWLAGLQKSCYISPPLGGFYEHETEIFCPKGKVRPSLFGAEWGQEGSVGAVRPTDHPRVLRAYPCWGSPGEQIEKLPPPSAPGRGLCSGRRCCPRGPRRCMRTESSHRCWRPSDI